jgi:hypothetical protein
MSQDKPIDFAKVLHEVKELTKGNHHSDSLMLIAKTLDFPKIVKVLESVEDIEKALGYMPSTLIGFRETMVSEMLIICRSNYSPAFIAEVARLFKAR